VADLTLDEAIDRARAIEVESYDVFLDLTAEPVLSRTEIRFRWRRADASTFAELRTPGVRSATLDGVSLPPPEDGRLRLSPAGHGDQAVLVVEAEAGYSPEGRGLSRFTDPADGAGYVLAFCYPDCGPELFCCFDQPDLTATFRFAVRVPDGWECVANGQLAWCQDGLHTFTPVSGMRPYDLTFCAGPFSTAARAQAGRTDVTVRHRQSLIGQAAVAALPQFADYARDAIAWYADRLGVPCPYPAYDIVFMADLPAMALSVPGLMVVNERLLGRPAGTDDQRSAMICAHEVAHLWFGALVGPRWWDDVWLDEAIATYLSYAALAAIAGVSESQSWTGFAYTEKPQAYQADDLPSRQPVSSPVSTARQGRDKPYGILYLKGASVIRALAALIGDDALLRGLGDYLTRFAFGSATLDDLVECWSRASGQDLAGWAEQWLRAEGATTIRLDGTGAVVQDVPRRQRVGIGLYDRGDDGQLHRRRLIHAELDAERTVVPGLAAADAVLLNDQDLSYTRTGLDAGSRQVLAAAACQVGDPLSEAVGWNEFWLLVTSGEVPAAEFAALVGRRLQAGGLPAVGVETLLSRAVEAADAWAPPRQRAGLREQIADATRTAAGDPRKLALGFAASAQRDDQLAVLDAWLAGKDLPGGLAVDAELRARILFTLAARGRARAADIDALPELDPVTGAVNRATCLALRPDRAAKEAAWAVPLSPDQPARIAQAYAAGIWVPGQEELMAGYRDRYFAEVLPALAARTPSWSKSRLGGLLFPVTLISAATIEAAEAAEPPDKVLRLTVADQVTIMRRRLAARQAALADGSRRQRRVQSRVDAPDVALEDASAVLGVQRRLVDVALGVVPGEVAVGVVAANRAQHLRREQDVGRLDHGGQQVDAGLVVDAGVEEDVVHQMGLDRRALLPGRDPAEAPPVVRHGAAAVRDDQPQRREPAEQVAHQQLHEGGGVGVEVVRAEGVHGRVARGGDVDHGRHVELGHRLVQREPVGVGQRRRGPPRAGRVRVQVAADEPELGDAPLELGHRRVQRLARDLRELAHAGEARGEQPGDPVDKVVAHPRPGDRGGRVGDVVAHGRRPRGEDRQVGAALARDPQLVGLDRLPDLVVADRRVGRHRQRRVGQPGQLRVPVRRQRGGRRRVVTVAIDDHPRLPT
jgi:aminopeptidase N